MGLEKGNIIPKAPQESGRGEELSLRTDTFREVTVSPFFTGILQGFFSVISQRLRERRAEARAQAEIREVTGQSSTSESK